jgi:nucleotide-binding universal stress UspA family protein
MDAKIVVGIDGSTGSDAALAWAIDEAAAIGADIIAVHVIRPVLRPMFGGPVADTAPHGSDRVPSHPRSRGAEEYAAPLKTSGIAHRILTVQGHPAAEILRVADDEDAALIVVGNALHSTMSEIFLGSVAHELTHHAKRPMVIVPARSPATPVDALGRKQRASEGETSAAHGHPLTAVSSW